MNIHLWLVSIADQPWILGNKLVNKITKEQYHTFILIFLLVNLVN
jgi:hypothetical protein